MTTIAQIQPTVTNGPAVAQAIVRAPSASLEPASIAELRALARDAASSGFFGAKSPEQALMIMMFGRDLGLSYTQSLRCFHVIQGRPVLSADGMVAVCLQSDVCEYFRVTGDDTRAVAVTKRRGQPEQTYEFSMDDAKRAGLVGKDNWRMHPRRMLQARAKSLLARDVFPELLAGLYDADEIDHRPAPQAVEVVAEPVVQRDPQVKADFAQAIADASSLGELRAVGKGIATAVAHGDLSDEDKLELNAAYVKRQTVLRRAKAEAVATTIPAPADSRPSDADVAAAAAIDAGEG